MPDLQTEKMFRAKARPQNPAPARLRDKQALGSPSAIQRPWSLWWIKCGLLLGCLLPALPVFGQATQSLTLAWNPSSSPSVVGYFRYYGSSSGNYTNKLYLGNVTTATIPGLVTGQTYYFAVTAYDSSGSESALSPEIRYTIPVPTTVAVLPAPWQTSGLGGGMVTGNGSIAGGLYQVNGAGFLDGTLDSFQFLYQPLTGDGSITAQLIAAGNTGINGRIGVMIRQDLTSSSDYAFMGISPGGQIRWQRRSSTGAASTTSLSSIGSLPGIWLRLTRTGDILDGYQSVDGLNWTHVYSCSLPMPTTTYFGFAVASGSSNTLNAAVFTNVTVLPAPWQTVDVGTVCQAGSANVSAGASIVSGSGALSGTADSFRFLYQPLNGDGSITAALNSVANTGTNGQIGVMIRESLASNSAYAFMGISPDGRFRWQRRASTGAPTAPCLSTFATLPNAWVRVARTGNTLDGYQSPNGINWTHVYTCTLPMASAACIGLAVASGTCPLNSATFTDVTVVNPNPAPTVSLTSPSANGTSYTSPANLNLVASVIPNGHTIYSVQFYNGSTFLGDASSSPYSYVWNNVPAGSYSLSAVAVYDTGTSAASSSANFSVWQLAPPWQSSDLGSVGVAGSAGLSGGIYTVSGAGTLSGTADSFRFVYQPLTGDGSITARVNSLTGSGANGLVGVMIRETLSAASEYVLMGISPNGQFQWQRRQSTGALMAPSLSGFSTLPNAWLRVMRTGTRLDGYQSVDGSNWTYVYTCNMTMATNAYIGLAVSSGSSAVADTATYSAVTVVP